MFSLKHFKIKFVFIVGYFISIGASAHIRMVEPVPRSTSDSLKVAPCGGVARTNSPTTVAPGQVINVRWDETVDHLGYFTVEFSQSGEANFQEIFRLEDSQSGGGIHANSGQVTIPNQNCTDCTLRLIQYMLDDPANPKLYYACADFVVTDQVPLNPPPSGGQFGSERERSFERNG